jgi:hypothetical protein
MLTTNQVPFIAQVSVIPYSWAIMKVPSIYCTKGCSTQIYINHLTSKVLRMRKIINTKHVSIKH